MQEEGGVHKISLKGDDVPVNKQVGLRREGTHMPSSDKWTEVCTDRTGR
jgi:hypothetical protein